MIQSQNNNPDATYEEWTIMIYMSGDNDLSEFVPLNLGLLKSIGSSNNTNIIVLSDEKGNNNSRLNYVGLRNVSETPLSEMDPDYDDELNMGNNKTLENFVIWGMKNYPADKYVLIIWGHGKGWRGVAPDNSDYLTMNELDSGLSNIVEHNDGKKLDIIGFDACGMGMLEVFYQIKDYAHVAIASEKDIPEHGWPYYDFLKLLTENPSMSKKELADSIVNEYVKSYESGMVEDDDLSVSLTAVDLSKIDDIIVELEFKQIPRSELVYYEESDFCDLLHYARQTNQPNLERAINASIIGNRYWSNPDNPIPYANGMTIYYPKSYDSGYGALHLSKETDWDENLNLNNT